MDSTAFTNIYGLFTNTYKQEFKVKALEDYANLYLSISGVSDSAFVEILDSGDKPVRTAPVINGGAEFMYMNPGTYYARLFIDRNGNGNTTPETTPKNDSPKKFRITHRNSN